MSRPLKWRDVLVCIGAATVVTASALVVMGERAVYGAGERAGYAAAYANTLALARAQLYEEMRLKLRTACSSWFADKRRAQDPRSPVLCKQSAIHQLTGE